MTAINTIPNVTDVERDTDLTSVPKGSLIFNTDSDELQVNVSSGWISVLDSLNSSPEQNVYVSNDGNDLTGNGTIAFPYQTIEYALTQITDSSQAKPYTIKVVTGQYFETNLLLKPYVSLDGGNSQVQVSGSIALDSSYTAGGNLRIYDFGILDVISGIALDFDTLNSAQSIIFMQNCRTFFNTGIEISGSTNFTYFISDDLIGFELTLNNVASILQNQNLGNVNITKDNTFPSYGVQLKSTIVNGLFTVNQNSTGIESLVIDTANCLIDNDSNFTCATGTATLNWNSQGDRLQTINLDGTGLLFTTDGLSSIPNLTNGAIYILRNLSNGLLANYAPANYTPSDDSINGHLVGIDAELGINATLQITYDAGNTIQLSSERNLTISDSLGDLVFDVVEDGSNSSAVMYRKGVITDNSAAGPFFELNNSSIGQVGTELGTVSVSGLASDTSFRSFNAINHEVIDASPGNYSVSQFFNSYENGIETKYMEFDGIGQIEFYKTFDMKGNGIVSAGNINASGLSASNTVSAQDLTATDTVSGQNVLTDTLNISTSTANTLLSTDGFKNVVSGNLSGDVTTNNSLLTTLSTVNSNVGTFGDANNVSQVTVDSKGRITAVSNVSIGESTLQDVYDNSSPGYNIDLNTNLTFSGPNPGNNFQFSTSVGDALLLMRSDGSTANSAILRMEANGIVGAGLISRICAMSSSVLYGDISFNATVVTPGIEESEIVFEGVTNGSTSNFLKYTGSADNVEIIDTNITTTTASTSVTTGSLINNGGFGNAGNIYTGGDINLVGNVLFDVNNLSEVGAPTVKAANVWTNLINGIQPSGGLFLQTADGSNYTNSTTETSILGSGVGSLSVPANGFTVSGYKIDIAGNIDGQNGSTLTLRLVSNFTGTPVELGSVVIELETAVSQNFELEADFVIRTVGTATVAEIVTNMDFTYNRNTGNEFVGQRSVTSNSTTFDTTIANELFLTAEFDTATTSNAIQTKIATLTKTY